MYRIDRYYDAMCSLCGQHYSTDYSHGMEHTPDAVRKTMKKDGWKYDFEKRENICPDCVKSSANT